MIILEQYEGYLYTVEWWGNSYILILDHFIEDCVTKPRSLPTLDAARQKAVEIFNQRIYQIRKNQRFAELYGAKPEIGGEA